MSTYRISGYPKEMTLRDGRKVTVRPLAAGDEEILLQFFLRISEEERFFLKDDVTSPKVISEWVSQLDYRRALPLLALMDGNVVADAVLVRHRGNARSHVGEVRVVVDPEFRSAGLGIGLLRELCDIADDAGLEKVLFEVVAEKEQEAQGAAERLGFLPAARIEGGARDHEGHMHDLVLLVMPLGKWYQWSKF